MADGISAIANLLGKTNANGALVVTLDGGSASATTYLAGDGTASAPSYAFTAQTNTGWYHTGTGGSSLMRLSVNGSNTIQFDSSAGVYMALDNCRLSLGATSPVQFTRPAAFSLMLANAANAVRWSVAKNFASTTDHQSFSVDWQTVANTALVGTRTGSTNNNQPMMLASQSSNASGVYSLVTISSSAPPFFRVDPFTTTAYVNTDANGPGNIMQFGGVTRSSQTSGQVNYLALLPVYNQSAATTNNTDFLINRTETAVGSGVQNLIDAQVGGTSNFRVSSNGQVFSASTMNCASGVVTPAGGNSTAQFRIGGSMVAIAIGTGAPSLSAPKGSLYLNTTATTTTTRIYVNTDGATTWTNLTTAA